jgi:hypothetical protein
VKSASVQIESNRSRTANLEECVHSTLTISLVRRESVEWTPWRRIPSPDVLSAQTLTTAGFARLGPITYTLHQRSDGKGETVPDQFGLNLL